jgi:MSHA biogenesis protein MshM
MSMYLAHFGLTELPFSITPDTDFAYRAPPHQAAMTVLQLALAGGEGFVKVTGEVGTGKTLLCRQLLASLGANVVSAYLLNPRLSPPELLRSVGLELGLQLPRGQDEHALCEALEAELLHLAAQDQRVVLCIDEAQALPLESLEALRLLSNLETAKRKLIQIVLFGQPELDDMLHTRAARSLASRITFSAYLRGLSRLDLGHYLQHRLVVAGWRGPAVFSPAALWCLHRASGGVPRLANVLAHKCLMLAYGRGLHRVGWRMAWACVQDRSVPKRAGWRLGQGVRG